jgi:hypothetical protein
MAVAALCVLGLLLFFIVGIKPSLDGTYVSWNLDSVFYRAI